MLGKTDIRASDRCADTSPFNYLILLGHLQLLSDLFGRVLVPAAVVIEMQYPDAPLAVSAWAADPPRWVERVQVQTLDPSLSVGLDLGEREAISLAIAQHADVLLMDELAGRREAESRHLVVAGTLAVLLQAAVRDWLDLSTGIGRLRQYGFYFSRALEAEFLALYERQKRSHPTEPIKTGD